MDLIAKLYHVESVARQEGLDANALTLRRHEHSLPVLIKIKTLMLANLHAVATATLLGKALHYAEGQWPKLEGYVGDGRHPIDNNAARIRSACSRSCDGIGYSQTPWAAPMPARTCTRCCGHARPMVSTATRTCADN